MSNKLNTTNYRPQLMKLFEENPNSTFTFNEVHEIIGGEYSKVYSQLQYLVKCKIVEQKKLPNEKNNCYTKRNKL